MLRIAHIHAFKEAGAFEELWAQDDSRANQTLKALIQTKATGLSGSRYLKLQFRLLMPLSRVGICIAIGDSFESSGES